MSKSETLLKLATIQKDIENLELAITEVNNDYFTKLAVDVKIETRNFNKVLDEFSLDLASIPASQVLEIILKNKRAAYDMVSAQL